MDGFAPFTVSTFRAVHAGFNRNEEAIVDRFFDLPRKEDETLEIIVRPERVELMVSRRFCLGEDVEPEQRIHAVFLLVGVTERCRLKITVSFSIRPFHRSRFPVADRLVSAVNGNEVKFSDQWLAEARYIHAERFCHRFDQVVVRPVGKSNLQHVAATLIPEPVVLIRLVRQVLADLGFTSEVDSEILLRVLYRVAGSFTGAIGRAPTDICVSTAVPPDIKASAPFPVIRILDA